MFWGLFITVAGVILMWKPEKYGIANWNLNYNIDFIIQVQIIHKSVLQNKRWSPVLCGSKIFGKYVTFNDFYIKPCAHWACRSQLWTQLKRMKRAYHTIW